MSTTKPPETVVSQRFPEVSFFSWKDLSTKCLPNKLFYSIFANKQGFDLEYATIFNV